MSQQPSAPMSAAPAVPAVPDMPAVPAVPEPPSLGPRGPHIKSHPPEWFGSLDARSLWAGGAAAAASYITVFLVSMVLLLIALTGISASNGGELTPTSTSGFPGQDQLNVWSMVGQLTAQLLAMAHLGGPSAVIDGAVPFLGTIHGDASGYAVPLSILALSILSVYSSSRVAELKMPSGSRVQLLAQSLVTGVVYAAAVNVVAAATALRFPASNGFTASPVTAAGLWPVVFSLCMGFAVSVVARGRASTNGYGPAVPVQWTRLTNLPLAAVSSHLLVFAGVAVPTVWTMAVVAGGWAGLLTAPMWVLNAAGLLFVAGHLGGLHLYTVTTQIMGGSGNGDKDQLVYGLGGDVANGTEIGIVVGALVLAVICTLISGTVVLLRRGHTDNARLSGWLGIPAAYLTLGVVLLPLLSSSAAFNLGAVVRGTYSLGPVWWSPAVFLLWGLLVELSARFVAPYVLPFVPGRLQGIARLGVPLSSPMPAVTDVLPAPEHSGDPAADGPINVESGSGDRTAFVAPLAKKLSPAAKKRALIVALALGLVTVLTIGGLVAVNVVKAGNGPDKAVGEYIQALVDGDAEKAVKISDPDVANEERALLTNAVYGAATKRIDGFTVLSSDVAGDTATVRVEVRQDGRRSEVPFTLNKDQPEFLDDNWKLKSNGFNVVGLSANADVAAFAVNGVTINNPKGSSGGYGSVMSLPAFPGEYTVGLPQTEKYITADEKRILVTIGSSVRASGSTSLEVTASKDLQSEVAGQLEKAWSACAASTELRPKGCPFRKYEFGDSRNVKWSITAKPQFSLQRSYDGTWRISTETDGSADVTYERNASFSRERPDWKPEKDSASFRANGSVKVVSDKVVVELSEY